MIPIILCTNGLTVVITGGGAVAKQKFRAFSKSNCVVRVIDPVAEAWQGVEWIAEPYRAEHLDGAGLAIAAATSEVNAQVVKDARAARILVCNASDPQDGDFVLPAVVRRGDLQISITTGGASPTLSRRIQQQLEGQFGSEYADWVTVLQKIRRLVRANIPDAMRRRELLTDFAEDRWLERLVLVGAEVVYEEMRFAVDLVRQSL